MTGRPGKKKLLDREAATNSKAGRHKTGDYK